MQAEEHAQHLKNFNSTCVTSVILSQGCLVNRQCACLPLAAVVSPQGETVMEKAHPAAGGKQYSCVY